MLNIRLFRRGPGRRRLPEAYATAQARIAELDAAVETAKASHAAELKGQQDALQQAARTYRRLYDTWDALRTEHEAQGRELAQLKTLLAASDGRPVQHVPSPIQQGCRDTPRAAERTVQATLADLEQEGDRPTIDLLAGLRAAAKGPKPPLRGEITQELVRPLHQSPAAEVSPVTGERARESINAAVGAAS